LFASGIGNTGFAAVVIDDDDEIGCFGAAVGLAGSFFTVLVKLEATYCYSLTIGQRPEPW
jgi:hypothetical protein